MTRRQKLPPMADHPDARDQIGHERSSGTRPTRTRAAGRDLLHAMREDAKEVARRAGERWRRPSSPIPGRGHSRGETARILRRLAGGIAVIVCLGTLLIAGAILIALRDLPLD